MTGSLPTAKEVTFGPVPAGPTKTTTVRRLYRGRTRLVVETNSSSDPVTGRPLQCRWDGHGCLSAESVLSVFLALSRVRSEFRSVSGGTRPQKPVLEMGQVLSLVHVPSILLGRNTQLHLRSPPLTPEVHDYCPRDMESYETLHRPHPPSFPGDNHTRQSWILLTDVCRCSGPELRGCPARNPTPSVHEHPESVRVLYRSGPLDLGSRKRCRPCGVTNTRNDTCPPWEPSLSTFIPSDV